MRPTHTIGICLHTHKIQATIIFLYLHVWDKAIAFSGSTFCTPKFYFFRKAYMKSRVKNSLQLLAISACLMWTLPSYAGNIIVSGHDADFHAITGNTAGVQHFIQQSLLFARNGNTAPILFVQSDTSNISLGDHLNSELGLIASGYTAGNTPGNHYVIVNSTTLSTINLSPFSAIFVPSDHGGTLTGNDLRALNNRAPAIISYLNAGGWTGCLF